jgi:diguanylate cyclase (GGDEF)-like protein
MIMSQYLAQAGLAAVVAVLLLWFHKSYRRGYLLAWGAAWSAFAVHLVAAAAGLQLAVASAPTGARIAVSAVAQVAGFLHIAWLLVGASGFRVGGGRRPPARLVLAAFVLLGVLVTVTLALTSGPAVTFMRYGLRALIAAAAYGAVAWWVHVSPVWPDGAGRRIVTFGFAAYALEQLQYSAGTLAPVLGLEWPIPGMMLGPVDIVLQAVLGFGMGVGLVEQERARAVAAAEELERLNYHDSSTDMPNRRLLLEYLQHALARARRTGERLALAHLDIDRFNTVNEAWSHGTGDAVLRGIAERLRALLRDADLVAHLGGDSFAVLFAGHSSEEQLLTVTERMARRLRQPFLLHEREINLTASIGVACFPEHASEPDGLLAAADTAMARAKEMGRNRTLFFEPMMNERAREKVSMERALRRAVGGDELVLHYQPIVAVASGQVARFEALLRWRHPERGLLLPDAFLPLVDVIGLTDAVDQWVLRTACEQARRWRELPGSQARVAVNLSAAPLQDPNLVRRIETVLADTGLPATALEIEVTESAAMEHAETTLTVLRGLKRLGVRLALDDFGTGYSSLSYLRSFPIDTIKIDRAFVRDLGHQPNARTLIAGIIALARSLDLAVVAEGVESEDQRAILAEEGCSLMQGYLVGRPLPADEMPEVIVGNHVAAMKFPPSRPGLPLSAADVAFDHEARTDL